jgi:hypothetical protein
LSLLRYLCLFVAGLLSLLRYVCLFVGGPLSLLCYLRKWPCYKQTQIT